MRLGAVLRHAAGEPGAAPGELRPQMRNLEAQLPVRGGELRVLPADRDEGLVEAVSTGRSFVMNGSKVGRDRRQRIRAGPETFELGMMTVSAGPAFEDALREKGFAPYSDESLRIEVFRMKGPESQRGPGWRLFEGRKRDRPQLT